jgi:uncharacterized protein (DUF983 family)
MARSIVVMLGSGLRLKCPRCGIGPLFRRAFSMYPNCPECGLKFEREQGYFVGAIYINYAATVLIAVPGFFILDLWTRMTIDQQLALWLPFAVIFPVIFFHHSRSLWLILDHLVNPTNRLYSLPPKKPG